MKKQIIISIILILSVVMLYSFRSGIHISSTQSVLDSTGKFLIGAMHDGIDANYIHNTEPGFNVWHHYTGPTGFGWPGVSNDNMNTATSQYADAIRNRLDNNNSHNMFTLMDRPKIEYLAFGQRSDYQCEPIAVGQPYWFYSYDSTFVGTPVPDSNQIVMRCTTNQGQGWIAKNLRSNREQANYFWPLWINDDTYPWYVLPRIRINPQDTLTNKRVCRIEIINWNDSIIKSIDLGSRNNFRTASNPYSGQYLEEYYFQTNEPKLEFGPGKILNPLDSFITNYAHCHIDFRVWYYNECEMWIDRIRVENDPAHKLLTLKSAHEDSMIVSEINEIALPELNSGNLSPIKFYIEEFEFNTVPCLSYINKRIDTLSDHKMSLMINLNYELFQSHMPDYSKHWFTAEQIKSYLIDSVQSKEIFMGAYSLEGWETDNLISKSPNTLPIYNTYSGDYEKNLGILSYKTSPGVYDDWLQESFDNYNTGWKGTKYTYLMRMAESISKNSNIPFYNLMQTHLWWAAGHKLKEPSNEELKMMANLAVAYGAKGIMYFAYNSESDTFNVADTMHYSRGLVNPDLTPRTLNVYGQNKWEAINKIDSTLKKWGPYLMSFDNTNRKSFIYRNPSERADLNNYTFIRDMSSFPADPLHYPVPDPDVLNLETNNNTYLQASFFQKQNETEQNKYFMIINRRCSPFKNYNTADNIGGKRFVFMRVNSTNLQGFNNWKIIDLKTGDSVLTFNKNDTAKNLYLGEYDPGEGRLYRVSPVMQEGGTLAANEQVEGITFVCNGPVYNNGKDISILEGTKINFKTGAGINMTGGKLTCSNYSTNTSENVLLKGYNGPWNGIVMNNCMRSVIQRTRFEDAKNCIVISNANGVSKYTEKVIRRNYFKVTADSGKALTINNQMEMAIDSNTFEVTSFDYTAGIYYVNNDNTEPEEMPQAEEGIPEDEIGAGYINITKNIFNGAYFPVMINDMGSNFSQFYIYNNEFINTGLFGITGRKITGTIKQNKFTDEAQSYCLSLFNSSPDVGQNVFRSELRDIVLLSSFPSLAPVRNGNNQLVFYGGRNSLSITTTNVAAENIKLKNSLPIIFRGENNFSIGNTYSSHLYGIIPSEYQRIYPAGRNCWEGNNSNPRIFLYQGTDTTPIGYNYPPTYCIPSEETTPEIAGMGFGISDTSIVVNYDSTDILPVDQSLAYEAKDLLGSGDYSGAIANYKALIDTYDSSEYIYGAVGYLYSCYQSLDTSSEEATTDILYSDLKEYLESKISSGNYEEDFEELAYDFVLMCDTRLTNYNEALAGYEFIVTYNPDMEARLLASWEYQNIQDLLEGESGGRSNYELQITNYKFKEDEKELYNNLEIEKRIKELDELIDIDPVKKHLKEKFVKSADENIKAVKEGKAIKKNPNDEKFKDRSKQNIYGSRNLTKQQKEIRRFEDLKLLLNPDNLVVNKNIENAVPSEYSLSQNYPNPFNPVTHLEFGIPNLGFVSLKVFDILGREVKTLVNEIKPAGNFKVEFDGSNFASGVYFYRIEAGDFVQTKRMVLVK